MRPLPRAAATTALTVALAGAVLPASAADGTPYATAVLTDPSVASSATLTAADPSAAAVMTTPLAGFPRHGDSYIVLSSGRAQAIMAGSQDEQAATQFTTVSPPGKSGVYDVTQLKVDIDVPADVNCLLGVDFRFLSEEYPEYVGDSYNDAFIAEKGTSDWSVSGTTINAPHNFAFDDGGRPISINAGLFAADTGGDGPARTEAGGTVFDGATPILTAAVPLDPGQPVSLFFTIFDQADASYDSAVMIDNLRVGRVADPATQCRPGAQTLPATITTTAVPPTFTDLDGTAQDTVTIPSVDGVQYLVDGVARDAGTYPGLGTVVVEAVALEGYELTGTTEFSHTFTDLRTVTALAPTGDDRPGTAQDTLTVPDVTGVVYRLDGEVLTPGVHPRTGHLVVLAEAAGPQYVLTGPTEFVVDLLAEDLPGAPAPAVQPGPRSVELTWEAPEDDGGTPVTGYHVQVRTEGGAWTTVDAAVPGTALTVTDLTDGTPVELRVAAVNRVGQGPWGAVVEATPRSPAQAPVLHVTPGNEELLVTFEGPADSGGSPVQHYEVSLDGGVTWSAPHTSPVTFTGLTNGVTYPVTVRAVTAAGPGAAATPQDGTPLPASVTAPAPTADDRPGTADDTVTVPDVTGVVYVLDGEILTPGVHHRTGHLVLTAAASGPRYVLTGPSEFVLDLLAEDLPGAPTPTAVPAPRSVELTWTVPTEDGGTPITGYHVQVRTAGGAWTTVDADVPGTALTVTDLADGTPVELRVAAVNRVGQGPWGAVVDATPRSPAQAPTIREIRPGNRSLTVAFDGPTDDGGSPVQGYEISTDGGTTWTPVTGSPVTVTGLRNGTTYQVNVRAVTDAGPGAAAAPRPGTPTVAPVAVDEGEGEPERPTVPPGRSRLWVDGSPVPVTTGTDDGVWTVQGNGFAVRMNGVDPDGAPLPVDALGRLVVDEGGFVQVSGEGFAPGSLVDVWLFSTPYLLGEVTVGGDGAFSASLPLPADIAAGEHTVQLNGEAADGSLRSLATGIVVRAAVTDVPSDVPTDVPAAGPAAPAAGPAAPAATPPALADTGAEAGWLVLTALALLGLGSAAIVGSRRAARVG